MQRFRFFATGLALAFVAAGALAQSTTPADQKFFDEHMGELVKLEPAPLDNPELSKVFSARFYEVNVIVAGSGQKILVARQGNDLVDLTKPSTTAPMPGLRKLLDPGFRLKSDGDAHRLQDALDILYPVDSSFGDEDARAKTIRHAGDEWTFVRGKFFEHFKGFVFTTSADGVVTDVKYSLDIK